MRIINRGESDFSGLERTISLGLDRLASTGRLENKSVDIGFSLAAALDGQEAVSNKGLEMLSNIGLVQSRVFCQSVLASKTRIILPAVTEQHGECELVTRAEVLRFE
jgi:hypothetical protein